MCEFFLHEIACNQLFRLTDLFASSSSCVREGRGRESGGIVTASEKSTNCKAQHCKKTTRNRKSASGGNGAPLKTIVVVIK